MATLVLGGIGTAVGGPLGGALGALLGQSLDQGLFGSGPRGARLSDLSVQTSSYGNLVPRLYGTLRVAGTIVWAADIREEAAAGGGYLYSASFAVAVSSRPATRVGRIWADGRLLRGAAGDFKVATKFRFHPGSDDEPLDPLIASIEGLTGTPAYRGLAVAVFEDLHLAEFGNRIPQLTFEIVADEPGTTLGEILSDASDDAVRSADSTPILGYAAYGRDIAGALVPLVELYGVRVADLGGSLQHVKPAPPVEVAEADLGCSLEIGGAARLDCSLVAASDCPQVLSIAFHDPSRDFQTGQMQASTESRGGRAVTMELPIALESSIAKALAEKVLVRNWSERERMTIHLPPTFLGLIPGTVLRVQGETWSVKRCSIEGLVNTAQLVRVVAGPTNVLSADSGRAMRQADKPASPTSIVAFEMASSSAQPGDRLTVQVAVAGGTTPWRPVPLELEVGGLTRTIPSAARRAVIGVCEGSLGPGTSSLMDLTNSIEVQLGEDDWLTSCDDAALDSGMNLALVGKEVIQFGSVEALGAGRFVLRRLLRGRRGTEAWTSNHQTGEAFVLLDPAALTTIDVPISAVGTPMVLRAAGVSDPFEGKGFVLDDLGSSVRPLHPVHLSCRQTADETVRVTWVRRSRLGWTWLDHIDAALGESTEAYSVELVGGSGGVEKRVSTPACSFTAEECQALGSKPWTCSVAQVGNFGRSKNQTAVIA